MPRKVAIIGTGSAGMVTALSLKREFGDDVDIHVYDQSKSFNLSQGVELSPGPPFQIVMKALGHDVEAVMKEYACEHNTATVHDSAGNRIPFVEEIIESTCIYKAAVGKTPGGDVVECARFSINRGMFMSILQDEFFKAMGGKDAASKQLHWDHKLEEVLQQPEGKKTLRFANGEEVTGVDLVVGADGVHSAVRRACFDDVPATHVGANIIYGVIPGTPDIYHEHAFNIVVAATFSMVISQIVDSEGKRMTWWAMVHTDREKHDSPTSSPKAYRAFWESKADVQKLAHDLAAEEEGDTLPKKFVALTPEEGFRYAGFFLDRDPTTLKHWGNGELGAVCIGDAAHAIQPWAGMGASLAAEDAFVLGKMIAKHGWDNLQKAFDELQALQLPRVQFYRQITMNNAPKGIISEDQMVPIEQVVAEFGDQRGIEACPAWKQFCETLRLKSA
ncbi:BNA4 [Symbiodinium sp. KB8]|nr:BNA4 [Symbiodinium sp. KB8]